MADFELVAKRKLDRRSYKLFRYHFLLGADWQLCKRQLGIDRGTFYHAVYRIEEQLGEAFSTLEPYALYPARDYFQFRRTEGVKACIPIPRPSRSARSLGGPSLTPIRWEGIPA